MIDEKIMFGVCTYNRKDTLKKSILSLQQINDLDAIDVIVFDDCSTEYGLDDLKSMIPFAKNIVRQKSNVGADKNTSDMYEYFLNSNYQWLFNADSDLIYSNNIVKYIGIYKNQCNGFMTLFNCINHNDIARKGDFVLKDEVGAAGCLLNRHVVDLILSNIKQRSFGFDVGFSKLLRKFGYELLCTNQSYVQHIGINGYNSRNILFDYGKNFVCETNVNWEIIEETFEEYMLTVRSFRSSWSFKVYNFINSIPRRIKKLYFLIIRGRQKNE